MASGKSTVAQCLAEMLPKSVHLRGSIFRKMIVSEHVDMSAGAEKCYGGYDIKSIWKSFINGTPWIGA